VKLGLSLYGKNRLKVYENKVLKNTHEQRRDEVTQDWKKFHNKELCNFYSAINVVW
jgi:hypothetical protein